MVDFKKYPLLLIIMTNDSLSDEDIRLFRDHVRLVKPLNEQNKRVKISKNTSLLSPKPYNDPFNITKKEYYLSDFINETVSSEGILSFCKPEVASKRFHALKQGSIPWEARLDLHGLNTDAARDALTHFIHTQYSKNNRCLLIIHGKGGHQGAPPLIKNLINRWLPQFEELLAFHSAQAKDGGRGAAYVLLKRNKESPL